MNPPPSHPEEADSILFVCLGNICRSPTAEGVFRHLAHERGVEARFRIASAGTGDWHAGELPDPRARACALRHGVELTSRAQVVVPARHFVEFNRLVALDRSIRARLLRLGAPAERVRLLREFDPSAAGVAPDHPSLDVPDPYTGPEAMFDEVFRMIRRACEGMLDAFRTP